MAPEIAPRIVVDPSVRFGKPVIQGTRVPVELLQESATQAPWRPPPPPGPRSPGD